MTPGILKIISFDYDYTTVRQENKERLFALWRAPYAGLFCCGISPTDEARP